MSSEIERRTTIVKPGEGKTLWVLAERITSKLDASHTGGTFSVAEIDVPPGSGPPPHLHGREDEMFFVLEGTFSFLRGGQTFVGKPGACVFLPKGIPHTFKNIGNATGRFLAFATPAGFEKFFQEVGTSTCPAPGAPDPAVVQRLIETSANYGLNMNPTLAGPPAEAGECPDGRCLGAMGMKVTIKLASGDTNGMFSVAEVLADPGLGPPPHRHRDVDEMFYTLEGTHEFLLDNDVQTLSPGSLVFVPRGTLHTFRNVGDEPARLFDLHTPGGFEAFFDEASTFTSSDPQAVAALLDRHGMELA